MDLKAVDIVENITRQDFQHNYHQYQKPLLIKNLAHTWPASQKWTFDWLKKNYGHLTIPLCDDRIRNAGKNYQVRDVQMMSFNEYLTLIETQPSTLRMFLYNIAQHAPELKKDIVYPDLMDGFNERFIYTFFGGKGSRVPFHYDIDLGSVFHTQIEGKKRFFLVSNEQAALLYHTPFTVQAMVDPTQPNYKKFPASRYVKGYDVTLDPGDTLYIPSGFFHHVEYLSGAFGVSLRAHDQWLNQIKGLQRIICHAAIDLPCNRFLGEQWKDWKQKKSFKVAHREMKRLELMGYDRVS
ncbi:cupin-like domain-containing protein [bacterium]|nr:cupin-like domain-containing protein [bacterium]